MSLSTDFLANFQTFIRNRALLIPAQVAAGNGTFQLTANGNASALLQNQGVIPGYYAKPAPNSNNVFALPTQLPATSYMFTDQMNGCQFLAYDPDRQHVTVEHNNFINNPALYAARLTAITNQHNPYFFHLSAGAVANIPAGTYSAAAGINIVGEYTTVNGWRFFVRDHVDQNQGTVYGPL